MAVGSGFFLPWFVFKLGASVFMCVGGRENGSESIWSSVVHTWYLVEMKIEFSRGKYFEQEFFFLSNLNFNDDILQN